MTGKANLRWDRVNEALVDSCGYLLLAVATVLGVIEGDATQRGDSRHLRIAAAAAAWIYVMYTRLPRPRKDQRVRIAVFFIGLLVFASVLLLRQPVFFIFMISGFFYASMLRPLPAGCRRRRSDIDPRELTDRRTSDDARGVDLLPDTHRHPDRSPRRRRDRRREGVRTERGASPDARPTPGCDGRERWSSRSADDTGPRGGRAR